MNTPSIKTLAAIFHNRDKQAKEILTCSHDALLSNAAVQAYIGQSYQRFNSRHWRMREDYLRLIALNALGDFYGIEACETESGEYADYLNAGDTYACTLIYWRGRYRVQCLGDFVETMEKRGIHFK